MSPEKVVVDQESKHLEQPRPVRANFPREKFPQQRETRRPVSAPVWIDRRRSLRLLIRLRLLPGGLVVRERAPAARFAPPAKEEPARRRGVRRGICRTIRRTIFGTRRTNSGPVSPGVARVDKVARVAPAALTQLPVPARPRPLPSARAAARVSPLALRRRRIVALPPDAATFTFSIPVPAPSSSSPVIPPEVSDSSPISSDASKCPSSLCLARISLSAARRAVLAASSSAVCFSDSSPRSHRSSASLRLRSTVVRGGPVLGAFFPVPPDVLG